MATISVDLDTIQTTTAKALEVHGAKPWIADSVAHAVRIAEAHGNKICGLFIYKAIVAN